MKEIEMHGGKCFLVYDKETIQEVITYIKVYRTMIVIEQAKAIAIKPKYPTRYYKRYLRLAC